ncbi:hypothetical protein PGTUg99_009173 [Puccinia graminis f. sp. tritici]|uniref:Retrotransposon gag domain-containing protein n=1 Tax=Puccinia graminis f. sp. tritici TaxID=56615 RepID=A0A5B0PJ19_PUCGR|nr:hypothetical protein PGTUg99_009173 [Puccinia graminis f. sp. tritici]
MPTRSTIDSEILDPVPDPEALIRRANAEQRHKKQLLELQRAALLGIAATTPLPIESSPLDTRTPSPNHSKMAALGSSSNEPISAQELLLRLMAVQETSIKLAQADREAAAEDRREAADRIARLENAMVKMSLKNDTSNQQSLTSSNRIDLQKFKISDGPSFKGPFQEVEPFLKWIHGTQIFFSTKAVLNDADKIRIIGGLIAETNLLSFYANEAESFIDKPWADFKKRLFEVALPTEWRTTLKMKIRQLRMFKSESFIKFSTRACTLQSMFNFDKKDMDDFELAEYVSFGVSEDLHVKINDFGILQVEPFVYAAFEKKAATYYEGLTKKTTSRNRAPVPNNQPTTQSGERTGRDETIWRLKAYLDMQGRCHFCKKKCGSTPGNCPYALDRSHMEIPTAFKAPPMPEGWKASKVSSGLPSSTAGKPTQAPAGRHPNRAATVAAVSEDNMFPALDAASVSALAQLDEELSLATEERCVEGRVPKRLIIDLKHGVVK